MTKTKLSSVFYCALTMALVAPVTSSFAVLTSESAVEVAAASGCPECPAETEFDNTEQSHNGSGLPSASDVENNPSEAACSWSIEMTGWSRLSFESGTCSPVTPAGCAVDPGCALSATGGDVEILVKDKDPQSNGHCTSPMVPRPPWTRANPGHSPSKYKFVVSDDDPQWIHCGDNLDLTFTWTAAGGNEESWKLIFKCGEGVDCLAAVPVF